MDQANESASDNSHKIMKNKKRYLKHKQKVQQRLASGQCLRFVSSKCSNALGTGRRRQLYRGLQGYICEQGQKV